jgi:hypothetical protein
MNLEFSSEIFEKSTNIKFFKIRPLGAQMYHADWWTDKQADTTKVIVAFGNFASFPKNPTGGK